MNKRLLVLCLIMLLSFGALESVGQSTDIQTEMNQTEATIDGPSNVTDAEESLFSFDVNYDGISILDDPRVGSFISVDIRGSNISDRSIAEYRSLNQSTPGIFTNESIPNSGVNLGDFFNATTIVNDGDFSIAPLLQDMRFDEPKEAQIELKVYGYGYSSIEYFDSRRFTRIQQQIPGPPGTLPSPFPSLGSGESTIDDDLIVPSNPSLIETTTQTITVQPQEGPPFDLGDPQPGRGRLDVDLTEGNQIDLTIRDFDQNIPNGTIIDYVINPLDDDTLVEVKIPEIAKNVTGVTITTGDSDDEQTIPVFGPETGQSLTEAIDAIIGSSLPSNQTGINVSQITSIADSLDGLNGVGDLFVDAQEEINQTYEDINSVRSSVEPINLTDLPPPVLRDYAPDLPSQSEIRGDIRNQISGINETVFSPEINVSDQIDSVVPFAIYDSTLDSITIFDHFGDATEDVRQMTVESDGLLPSCREIDPSEDLGSITPSLLDKCNIADIIENQTESNQLNLSDRQIDSFDLQDDVVTEIIYNAEVTVGNENTTETRIVENRSIILGDVNVTSLRSKNPEFVVSRGSDPTIGASGGNIQIIHDVVLDSIRGSDPQVNQTRQIGIPRVVRDPIESKIDIDLSIVDFEITNPNGTRDIDADNPFDLFFDFPRKSFQNQSAEFPDVIDVTNARASEDVSYDILTDEIELLSFYVGLVPYGSEDIDEFFIPGGDRDPGILSPGLNQGSIPYSSNGTFLNTALTDIGDVIEGIPDGSLGPHAIGLFSSPSGDFGRIDDPQSDLKLIAQDQVNLQRSRQTPGDLFNESDVEGSFNVTPPIIEDGLKIDYQLNETIDGRFILVDSFGETTQIEEIASFDQSDGGEITLSVPSSIERGSSWQLYMMEDQNLSIDQQVVVVGDRPDPIQPLSPLEVTNQSTPENPIIPNKSFDIDATVDRRDGSTSNISGSLELVINGSVVDSLPTMSPPQSLNYSISGGLSEGVYVPEIQYDPNSGETQLVGRIDPLVVQDDPTRKTPEIAFLDDFTPIIEEGERWRGDLQLQLPDEFNETLDLVLEINGSIENRTEITRPSNLTEFDLSSDPLTSPGQYDVIISVEGSSSGLSKTQLVNVTLTVLEENEGGEDAPIQVTQLNHPDNVINGTESFVTGEIGWTNSSQSFYLSTQFEIEYVITNVSGQQIYNETQVISLDSDPNSTTSFNMTIPSNLSSGAYLSVVRHESRPISEESLFTVIDRSERPIEGGIDGDLSIDPLVIKPSENFQADVEIDFPADDPRFADRSNVTVNVGDESFTREIDFQANKSILFTIDQSHDLNEGSFFANLTHSFVDSRPTMDFGALIVNKNEPVIPDPNQSDLQLVSSSLPDQHILDGRDDQFSIEVSTTNQNGYSGPVTFNLRTLNDSIEISPTKNLDLSSPTETKNLSFTLGQNLTTGAYFPHYVDDEDNLFAIDDLLLVREDPPQITDPTPLVDGTIINESESIEPSQNLVFEVELDFPQQIENPGGPVTLTVDGESFDRSLTGDPSNETRTIRFDVDPNLATGGYLIELTESITTNETRPILNSLLIVVDDLNPDPPDLKTTNITVVDVDQPSTVFLDDTSTVDVQFGWTNNTPVNQLSYDVNYNLTDDGTSVYSDSETVQLGSDPSSTDTVTFDLTLTDPSLTGEFYLTEIETENETITIGDGIFVADNVTDPIGFADGEITEITNTVERGEEFNATAEIDFPQTGFSGGEVQLVFGDDDLILNRSLTDPSGVTTIDFSQTDLSSLNNITYEVILQETVNDANSKRILDTSVVTIFSPGNGPQDPSDPGIDPSPLNLLDIDNVDIHVKNTTTLVDATIGWRNQTISDGNFDVSYQLRDLNDDVQYQNNRSITLNTSNNQDTVTTTFNLSNTGLDGPHSIALEQNGSLFAVPGSLVIVDAPPGGFTPPATGQITDLTASIEESDDFEATTEISFPNVSLGSGTIQLVFGNDQYQISKTIDPNRGQKITVNFGPDSLSGLAPGSYVVSLRENVTGSMEVLDVRSLIIDQDGNSPTLPRVSPLELKSINQPNVHTLDNTTIISAEIGWKNGTTTDSKYDVDYQLRNGSVQYTDTRQITLNTSDANDSDSVAFIIDNTGIDEGGYIVSLTENGSTFSSPDSIYVTESIDPGNGQPNVGDGQIIDMNQTLEESDQFRAETVVNFPQNGATNPEVELVFGNNELILDRSFTDPDIKFINFTDDLSELETGSYDVTLQLINDTGDRQTLDQSALGIFGDGNLTDPIDPIDPSNSPLELKSIDTVDTHPLGSTTLVDAEIGWDGSPVSQTQYTVEYQVRDDQNNTEYTDTETIDLTSQTSQQVTFVINNTGLNPDPYSVSLEADGTIFAAPDTLFVLPETTTPPTIPIRGTITDLNTTLEESDSFEATTELFFPSQLNDGNVSLVFGSDNLTLTKEITDPQGLETVNFGPDDLSELSVGVYDVTLQETITSQNRTLDQSVVAIYSDGQSPDPPDNISRSPLELVDIDNPGIHSLGNTTIVSAEIGWRDGTTTDSVYDVNYELRNGSVQYTDTRQITLNTSDSDDTDSIAFAIDNTGIDEGGYIVSLTENGSTFASPDSIYVTESPGGTDPIDIATGRIIDSSQTIEESDQFRAETVVNFPENGATNPEVELVFGNDELTLSRSFTDPDVEYINFTDDLSELETGSYGMSLKFINDTGNEQIVDSSFVQILGDGNQSDPPDPPSIDPSVLELITIDTVDTHPLGSTTIVNAEIGWSGSPVSQTQYDVDYQIRNGSVQYSDTETINLDDTSQSTDTVTFIINDTGLSTGGYTTALEVGGNIFSSPHSLFVLEEIDSPVETSLSGVITDINSTLEESDNFEATAEIVFPETQLNDGNISLVFGSDNLTLTKEITNPQPGQISQVNFGPDDLSELSVGVYDVSLEESITDQNRTLDQSVVAIYSDGQSPDPPDPPTVSNSDIEVVDIDRPAIHVLGETTIVNAEIGWRDGTTTTSDYTVSYQLRNQTAVEYQNSQTISLNTSDGDDTTTTTFLIENTGLSEDAFAVALEENGNIFDSPGNITTVSTPDGGNSIDPIAEGELVDFNSSLEESESFEATTEINFPDSSGFDDGDVELIIGDQVLLNRSFTNPQGLKTINFGPDDLSELSTGTHQILLREDVNTDDETRLLDTGIVTTYPTNEEPDIPDPPSAGSSDIELVSLDQPGTHIRDETTVVDAIFGWNGSTSTDGSYDITLQIESGSGVQFTTTESITLDTNDKNDTEETKFIIENTNTETGGYITTFEEGGTTFDVGESLLITEKIETPQDQIEGQITNITRLVEDSEAFNATAQFIFPESFDGMIELVIGDVVLSQSLTTTDGFTEIQFSDPLNSLGTGTYDVSLRVDENGEKRSVDTDVVTIFQDGGRPELPADDQILEVIDIDRPAIHVLGDTTIVDAEIGWKDDTTTTSDYNVFYQIRDREGISFETSETVSLNTTDPDDTGKITFVIENTGLIEDSFIVAIERDGNLIDVPANITTVNTPDDGNSIDPIAQGSLIEFNRSLEENESFQATAEINFPDSSGFDDGDVELEIGDQVLLNQSFTGPEGLKTVNFGPDDLSELSTGTHQILLQEDVNADDETRLLDSASLTIYPTNEEPDIPDPPSTGISDIKLVSLNQPGTHIRGSSTPVDAVFGWNGSTSTDGSYDVTLQIESGSGVQFTTTESITLDTSDSDDTEKTTFVIDNTGLDRGGYITTFEEGGTTFDVGDGLRVTSEIETPSDQIEGEITDLTRLLEESESLDATTQIIFSESFDGVIELAVGDVVLSDTVSSTGFVETSFTDPLTSLGTGTYDVTLRVDDGDEKILDSSSLTIFTDGQRPEQPDITPLEVVDLDQPDVYLRGTTTTVESTIGWARSPPSQGTYNISYRIGDFETTREISLDVNDIDDTTDVTFVIDDTGLTAGSYYTSIEESNQALTVDSILVDEEPDAPDRPPREAEGQLIDIDQIVEQGTDFEAIAEVVFPDDGFGSGDVELVFGNDLKTISKTVTNPDGLKTINFGPETLDLGEGTYDVALQEDVNTDNETRILESSTVVIVETIGPPPDPPDTDLSKLELVDIDNVGVHPKDDTTFVDATIGWKDQPSDQTQYTISYRLENGTGVQYNDDSVINLDTTDEDATDDVSFVIDNTGLTQDRYVVTIEENGNRFAVPGDLLIADETDNRGEIDPIATGEILNVTSVIQPNDPWSSGVRVTIPEEFDATGDLVVEIGNETITETVTVSTGEPEEFVLSTSELSLSEGSYTAILFEDFQGDRQPLDSTSVLVTNQTEPDPTDGTVDLLNIEDIQRYISGSTTTIETTVVASSQDTIGNQTIDLRLVSTSDDVVFSDSRTIEMTSIGVPRSFNFTLDQSIDSGIYLPFVSQRGIAIGSGDPIAVSDQINPSATGEILNLTNRVQIGDPISSVVEVDIPQTGFDETGTISLNFTNETQKITRTVDVEPGTTESFNLSGDPGLSVGSYAVVLEESVNRQNQPIALDRDVVTIFEELPRRPEIPQPNKTSLELVDVAAPDEHVIGQNSTIKATITTNESITDRSIDVALVGGESINLTSRNVTINAGENRTIEFKIDDSINVTRGPYYLEFSSDVVFGLSDFINVIEDPSFVLPSEADGEIIEIDTNLDDGLQTTVEIEVPDRGFDDQGDLVLRVSDKEIRKSIQITPNETKTVTFDRQISLDPGRHTVIFGEELNENNEFRALDSVSVLNEEIERISSPLRVNEIDQLERVEENIEFDTRLTIENRGDQSFDRSITLQFESESSIVNQTQSINLSPGETKTINFTSSLDRGIYSTVLLDDQSDPISSIGLLRVSSDPGIIAPISQIRGNITSIPSLETNKTSSIGINITDSINSTIIGLELVNQEVESTTTISNGGSDSIDITPEERGPEVLRLFEESDEERRVIDERAVFVGTPSDGIERDLPQSTSFEGSISVTDFASEIIEVEASISTIQSSSQSGNFTLSLTDLDDDRFVMQSFETTIASDELIERSFTIEPPLDRGVYIPQIRENGSLVASGDSITFGFEDPGVPSDLPYQQSSRYDALIDVPNIITGEQPIEVRVDWTPTNQTNQTEVGLIVVENDSETVIDTRPIEGSSTENFTIDPTSFEGLASVMAVEADSFADETDRSIAAVDNVLFFESLNFTDFGSTGTLGINGSTRIDGQVDIDPIISTNESLSITAFDLELLRDDLSGETFEFRLVLRDDSDDPIRNYSVTRSPSTTGGMDNVTFFIDEDEWPSIGPKTITFEERLLDEDSFKGIDFDFFNLVSQERGILDEGDVEIKKTRVTFAERVEYSDSTEQTYVGRVVTFTGDRDVEGLTVTNFTEQQIETPYEGDPLVTDLTLQSSEGNVTNESIERSLRTPEPLIDDVEIISIQDVSYLVEIDNQTYETRRDRNGNLIDPRFEVPGSSENIFTNLPDRFDSIQWQACGPLNVEPAEDGTAAFGVGDGTFVELQSDGVLIEDRTGSDINSSFIPWADATQENPVVPDIGAIDDDFDLRILPGVVSIGEGDCIWVVDDGTGAQIPPSDGDFNRVPNTYFLDVEMIIEPGGLVQEESIDQNLSELEVVDNIFIEPTIGNVTAEVSFVDLASASRLGEEAAEFRLENVDSLGVDVSFQGFDANTEYILFRDDEEIDESISSDDGSVSFNIEEPGEYTIFTGETENDVITVGSDSSLLPSINLSSPTLLLLALIGFFFLIIGYVIYQNREEETWIG